MIRHCEDCKQDFETRRPHAQVHCPSCQSKNLSRRRTEASKRYRAAHWKATEGAYCVLHDPDKSCGFNAGAKFNHIEVEAMLRLNAFTPGTRLDFHGRELVVTGGKLMEVS